MSPKTKQTYEFGPFRIDTANHLLRRDGQVVPVKPKVFDTLVALVESRGRLLEKDELMKALWPDSFVEEANLTQTIYMLRKALGEGPNEHNYIETIPKRGYRFVAAIRESGGEGADLAAKEEVRATVDGEEGVSRPGQSEIEIAANRRNGLILTVLVSSVMLAGLTAAGYYLGIKLSGLSTVPSDPIKSIAVLPFKPLVAEGRDAPLELSMADSLILKLGNLGQITVRPLSAVRRYTDLEQDAVEAGQELRVESVLEGNIQKLQDRIRVRVRLVRVRDGKQLWTEQFDENWTDIFTAQDRISQRVAVALALTLNGEEQRQLTKRFTQNPEAYQAYIRGRYFWNKSTGDGYRKAVEDFQRAIKIDPRYALAFAGLADSYNMLGSSGLMPMRESHTKARAAAEKALELDEQIAEAHTSLGAIIADYYWEWPEAEKHFRRAIALNPSYTTAHYWYSEYLSRMLRHEEAIRAALRAQELEPVSLETNSHVGAALYRARQYDGAVEQFRKTLELDPEFIDAHVILGLTLVQKGMYREAIAEFQKAIALTRNNPGIVSVLGYGYGMAGMKGEAQEVLKELDKLSRQGTYVSAFSKLTLYMALGEKDRAFEWLERAYEERFWYLGLLAADPLFDPLRSDPRYADLLRRMNLPRSE
jgi:DNA-binding winged helix-turn-helix (wHTH) protein/TolB-like protein